MRRQILSLRTFSFSFQYCIQSKINFLRKILRDVISNWLAQKSLATDFYFVEFLINIKLMPSEEIFYHFSQKFKLIAFNSS